MRLFDMTDGVLVPVLPTSLPAEGVLARTHLQAALRENQPSRRRLLVVAENSEPSATRNGGSPLCIDHEARSVVVELKRTNDGAHIDEL
jgi:hypothetical protein